MNVPVRFGLSPGTGTGAQAAADTLRCLIVPGLEGSGPDHWQSLWERQRGDCERVDLGCWDAPVRAEWVAALNGAVRRAPGQVVLVAHSLGCLVVAWWAARADPSLAHRVKAAMLVAPPDVGQQGSDHRLLRFAPAPGTRLPFRSILIASRDDRYAALGRSRALAAAWGAEFLDAGAIGHINSAAGLGQWPAGLAMLERLRMEPGR